MTSHQSCLSLTDFEKELEKYYVEQLKLNSARIFHDFPETWKYFWTNFKLNKNQVNEMMNKMQEDWQRTGLRFYGGPSGAYKKNNFITSSNGKHWIVWGFTGIRKDLNQYSSVVFG